MKKLLMLLLVGILTCSLIGCGGGDSDNNTTDTENVDNIEKEDTPVDVATGDVTLDAVMNAKESPAFDFDYVEVDGGIAIDVYNGQDDIVVIPEKIDGKTVVAINESAFMNNDRIKAVKIADTVDYVGQMAFMNCTGLEIAVCGKNVKVLDEYCFNNCTALKQVELNEGIECLKYGVFALDLCLKELYIPGSVTEIDYILVGDEEITLIVEAGSAAEQYAKDNGFAYETK